MTPDVSADASALEGARQLVLAGADANYLYLRWFHGETGEVTLWPAGGAYRAAILDPARFESGWRVVSAGHGLAGAVVAMRGGRERLVAPPEMVPDDPRTLAPGRGAALKVDPLASGEVGGFWHAWSADWQVEPPERYQRLYCRITPGHALDFAWRVAVTAPRHGAWAMKALCGPHDSGRRDCALIYLPPDSAVDSGWVATLLEDLQPHCATGLPPFVKPLTAGIGWALDPGAGRSFGEAVCGAVASAAAHAADAPRFSAVALTAIRSLAGMDRVRASDVG